VRRPAVAVVGSRSRLCHRAGDREGRSGQRRRSRRCATSSRAPRLPRPSSARPPRPRSKRHRGRGDSRRRTSRLRRRLLGPHPASRPL